MSTSGPGRPPSGSFSSLSGQSGVGSAPVLPGGVHKLCPTCGTRHPENFRVCPQDGSALLDADELVGTTVAGSYLITRILGEGGMGRVYEAQHARIKAKRFALKTLHPEFAQVPSILTRFEREAEVAAAVHSPHVVEVFDVNRTESGQPFLLSELLEGKELGDYLNAVGRMPIPFAVRVTRQICRGLEDAHRRGVVHRDVKPENVFLTGDLSAPTAKLIDFGISRLSDKPGLTRTGMIMGTPAYMPPEQAQGSRVDHRADIYATGAILYRALTGRPPFDRDEPTATLVAVLSEDPQRPRALNPDIPLELEAVIQRAMAKSPDARYASMAELHQALAPFDTEPGSAGAGAASPSPGRMTMTGAAPKLSARDAAQVAFARPALLVTAGLGAAALAAGLVSAIAAATRLARDDGAPLTAAGGALLALGVSFAIFGPAAAAAIYVRRRLWSDDARIQALGRGVGTPVAVALGAYGYASLLVLLMESVVLRSSIGLAWPVWDLLLFLIGAGAAAGAVVSRRLERGA